MHQQTIRRHSHQTRTISVCIPEDVIRILDQEASNAKVSRSLMVSELLRAGLKAPKQQEAR